MQPLECDGPLAQEVGVHAVLEILRGGYGRVGERVAHSRPEKLAAGPGSSKARRTGQAYVVGLPRKAMGRLLIVCRQRRVLLNKNITDLASSFAGKNQDLRPTTQLRSLFFFRF